MSKSKKRMQSALENYKNDIVSKRLEKLKFDERLLEPLEIIDVDMATAKETLGKAIGGFIPYVLVMFIFLGAMYPAIDLGAGEKERGSLETLLSSPATKFEITMGKLLVVSLTGLVSGLISVLGISSSLFFIDKIPVQIQETILELINPFMIGSIVILMIPIAIFFASMLLSISFYSRSFKEAQSLMGPLNMVIIVPLFLSLGPGMEMDHATALIPLINVGLLTKEILAGSVELIYFIETLFSLLFCAAIGIWFSVYWFNKENTIFFYNEAHRSKILEFKKNKITLIKTKINNNKKFNPSIIFKKLYTLGCRNVLVEGGDELTKNFIRNRIFNHFFLFKGSKNLSKSFEFKEFSGLKILKKNYKKRLKINSNFGKDTITLYKN